MDPGLGFSGSLVTTRKPTKEFMGAHEFPLVELIGPFHLPEVQDVGHISSNIFKNDL